MFGNASAATAKIEIKSFFIVAPLFATGEREGVYATPHPPLLVQKVPISPKVAKRVARPSEAIVCVRRISGRAAINPTFPRDRERRRIRAIHKSNFFNAANVRAGASIVAKVVSAEVIRLVAIVGRAREALKDGDVRLDSHVPAAQPS
jgi:hypothetical protein